MGGTMVGKSILVGNVYNNADHSVGYPYGHLFDRLFQKYKIFVVKIAVHG